MAFILPLAFFSNVSEALMFRNFLSIVKVRFNLYRTDVLHYSNRLLIGLYLNFDTILTH